MYEADRICFVSDAAAAIRWIRERSFPTAIELLDWHHLVEAFRRAIRDGRPDRHKIALAVAEPGGTERLPVWPKVARSDRRAGWITPPAFMVGRRPVDDQRSRLAPTRSRLGSDRRPATRAASRR